MGGRTIAIGLVVLAAACGSDNGGEGATATIRSGTAEEFCARYQELVTAYEDVAEVTTLDEMIATLEIAIADYQRLPIPTEIADDAQAGLSAMAEAVDAFKELDSSMDLNAPTREQRERLDAIADRMEAAEVGASSMRTFAQEHCS